MLQELKQLDVDERIDMDELVALSAFARGLQAEFTEQGLEVPAWLSGKTKSLRREVKLRNQDRIEKRLKDLQAQEEGLETAAQRRKKIADERKKLEAQLVDA